MLPIPPGLTLPQVEKPSQDRVVIEISIREHMPPYIALTWNQLEVHHFWVSQCNVHSLCHQPRFSGDKQHRNQTARGEKLVAEVRGRTEDVGRGNWEGGEGHEGSAPREEK